MSRTPAFKQLLRDRQLAPFRHAGAALRAAVLEHQDVVGGDVEIVALDLARHVVVVLERDRRAAMLQEPRIGGGRLHHAAARREIAGEHRGRAFRIERIVERMDDVGQMHLAVGDGSPERAAGHGDAA